MTNDLPLNVRAFIEEKKLIPIVDSGMVPSFIKIVTLYLDARTKNDAMTTRMLEDNINVGCSLFRHCNGKGDFQPIVEGIENMSRLNLKTMGDLKNAKNST